MHPVSHLRSTSGLLQQPRQALDGMHSHISRHGSIHARRIIANGAQRQHQLAAPVPALRRHQQPLQQQHQQAVPVFALRQQRHILQRQKPRGALQVVRASVPVAEPGKVTIGWLGAGIMGVPMVLNLLKAGYEVVVWNRTASRCDPLAAAGAKVVKTAREAAQASDITFAMLADPQAALEVVQGPDGVAAGLAPGKGYVDVSTVDAATAQQVAKVVKGAGALFLEAPVSGSKGPAEQGTLIFITAGDEELFKAASAPLDVMGKANFFLGDVGAAANMKLVVNMVMGSMMAAFSEGLGLADKAGLKHKDVIDIVGLGAIAAPMFALKGPAMANRSFPPAFQLKSMQKDMRLARELGADVGQSLAIAAAADAAYKAALEQQLGDADFSAVHSVIVPEQ